MQVLFAHTVCSAFCQHLQFVPATLWPLGPDVAQT